MRLYTSELLARLPDDAHRRLVAQLCRRDPETQTPAAAELIETWVDRYAPPKNIVSSLTDVNDDNLRSAIGELQVAAALDRLGYDIDMRPRFEREGAPALTPDLVATRGDLRLIVEVVTKKNDKTTQDVMTLLADIAAELEEKLRLPPKGFLALSVLPTPATDLTSRPSPGDLEILVAELNKWLDGDPYSIGFESLKGPMPVQGHVMEGDRPEVAIAPPGGTLGQRTRIVDALSTKIKRYADLAGPDTQLTVAVVAGGWKIAEGQVIDAMFGGEQVLLTGDGEVGASGHDGRGAAVPGSPYDTGGADKLSGVWFLEQAGRYQGTPPTVAARLTFAHNPFALHPIAHELVGAGRQFVPQDQAMVWLDGDRVVELR